MRSATLTIVRVSIILFLVFAATRQLRAQVTQEPNIDIRIGWNQPTISTGRTDDGRSVSIAGSPIFTADVLVAGVSSFTLRVNGELTPWRTVRFSDTAIPCNVGCDAYTVHPASFQMGFDVRKSGWSGLYAALGAGERLTISNPFVSCHLIGCPKPTPYASSGLQPVLLLVVATGMQPRRSGYRPTGEIALSIYHAGGSVLQRDLTFGAGVAF